MDQPSSHPVNVEMFDKAPLGARVADHVTGFLGSWRFLIIQSVIVLFWIAGNLALLTRPFDPYPFILLNLAFSTQAAYAAPLILLAQTRQAERDKVSEARDEQARQHAEEMASEQVAAIKTETDKLVELLNSNTELTRQDKELTERVEALTREIHARVTKG
jgi:uncharacterized membrane protein